MTAAGDDIGLRQPDGADLGGVVVLPADVIRAACRLHGVSEKDLRSCNRSQRVVRPRHLAMAVAAAVCGWGYSGLGRAFHRDRATVKAAVTKVAQDAALDPAIAVRVADIRRLARAMAVARIARMTGVGSGGGA